MALTGGPWVLRAQTRHLPELRTVISDSLQCRANAGAKCFLRLPARRGNRSIQGQPQASMASLLQMTGFLPLGMQERYGPRWTERRGAAITPGAHGHFIRQRMESTASLPSAHNSPVVHLCLHIRLMGPIGPAQSLR